MKKVFALTCLMAALIFADNDNSESGYTSSTSKRYQNYIGFAGGTTMGYGLSYKRWFNDKWGCQINLFPYYKEDKYSPKETSSSDYYYGSVRDSGYSNHGNLSLGLSYLRKIADTKYVRFMAYAGGNLNTSYEDNDYRETDHYGSYYDSYNNRTVYNDSSTIHKSTKTVNIFTLGSGCGSEFYVWRFGFNALLGFRGSYNFYNQSKELGLSFEGGVHFRF
jgi:hypothetical protein